MLAGTWSIRTSTAQAGMQKVRVQEKAKAADLDVGGWSSASDLEIAKEVLKNRKY
ncbi:hypothetical protein D3C87_1501870 [compost metagenome]